MHVSPNLIVFAHLIGSWTTLTQNWKCLSQYLRRQAV